ncbi:MAG: noncanonical pyrimidine nucleotidase, YjjG family [Bacteroidetes bacterium]|nr:noncanonical pyrimidine nucleotidase, YjjG family [Bacteroidota bacterium]
MKAIRHLFFDLDNTLWDFTRNSASVLEELHARFSLANVGIPTAAAFVERYEVHNEQAWKMYREGQLDHERLRWERYWRTLADFGCDNRKLAIELSGAYLETLAAQKLLMPGARQLIQQLHGQYPLHIVTNGFEEVQHNKLKYSGLDAYFLSVTTAEGAGVAKPDPRIFRSALAVAGALPEESLYIGDHATTDSSALAVGMHFLWYHPGHDGGNPEFDPKKTGPEAGLTVLQDLLDLPSWLNLGYF